MRKIVRIHAEIAEFASILTVFRKIISPKHGHFPQKASFTPFPADTPTPDEHSQPQGYPSEAPQRGAQSRSSASNSKCKLLERNPHPL